MKARTLDAEHICIARGGRLVLDDVNFRVAAGEALVITGPNGTGKTTLLRTIAGFLNPVSGTLTWSGGDDDQDLGSQCHYAGHLDAVKPRLTVTENLKFWSTYLTVEASAAQDPVERALVGFDLADLADVPASYLSAGQRRRLGLARLLSAPRAIWLLDEPTVSLDEDSRTRFTGLVQAHLAQGGIAICATHADLGLAAAKSLHLSAPRTAPA